MCLFMKAKDYPPLHLHLIRIIFLYCFLQNGSLIKGEYAAHWFFQAIMCISNS